jgi:F420H(2)-dependent quinone reductase
MTEFCAPEVTDESRFNGKMIAEFRANGGKVGGPFQGSDILLLHHTGARSGRQRVSPLAFQWMGSDLAVFAAKAGAPDNPGFAHYESAAAPRTIPVVVLEPVMS